MTGSLGERSGKGVRVQPLPIEVLEDEPFRNDLLGRRAFGEALSASLGAIEGPGVFAVDGQWGTGKTTFLRMFKQLLRNQKRRVIEINAWETDFAEDPLAALSYSLVAAIPEDSGTEKLKSAAVQLLRVAGPGAIRLLTGGLVNLDSAAQQEMGNALAKWAEDGLARFAEHEQSLRDFKDALKGMVAECDDRPIVFVVDELDRCRPTYAVAMLETIKHVFDVDGLVFVLAVNRGQLDRSARTLYGEFGDPESYFKRFFDVELRLPESDRKSVATQVLRQAGLRWDDVPGVLLVDFLAAGPQGIRVMQRTIQHYVFVHASLQRYQGVDSPWWMLPTFVLLRLIDEDAYRGLLDGSRSDAEVVESVFGLPWARGLRAAESGSMFEAAVILVSRHRHGASQLLEGYLSAEAVVGENRPQEDRQERDVLGWIDRMKGHEFQLPRVIKIVADRLDMLDLRYPSGA